MQVEPMGSRLLIKMIEQQDTTTTGIYLPETAKEKPQEAEVIAIGPDVDEDETPLNVGDTVMFAKYSGTEIKIDGKAHLIIDAGDILARIIR